MKKNNEENKKNVTTKKVKTAKKKSSKKKMTFYEKILKLLRENLYDVIFAVLSIIALIIGSLAIGFKKALIIVVIIDLLIWFLPVISFVGNKTKRKFKRRSIAQIFLWCVIAGLTACIAFSAFIVIKAPEFNPDNLYSKEATIIYDKDGKIVAKIGSEMREKVTYEELPEVLIDAIIATEDSQFFEHNGFNPLRFLKASITQVLTGGGGGASTITMQVSKNAFTSFEASGIDGIIRKFTDIYLSIFKIEKAYTKDQILEFYVNSYYMGDGAYGVEQACQNYFGKSVSEINLSEAAMIAGLFKGGYAYDPFIFPDNTEARRKEVLSLMERHGYITSEERKIAERLTVDDLIISERKSESYQAFIDTVVEEVKKKTKQNPYEVPMEIYTTLDTQKQTHINKVMNGEGYTWENDLVQAGIIVTDTNTGAIVAVGAGRNRKGIGTFNYATMINNQIGSTAKPLYDYAPAIEYNNLSPATPIVDEPYGYSDGTGMVNWDRKYMGLTTAREALVTSRNIPALKTFQSVKNSNIRNFVTSLGLSPQIEYNKIFESHSIGGYNGESPLSMAAAYAAFANGGTYIEPYSFTKIIFRETNEEFVNTYETKKVMSKQTAYLVTSMLIDTATYTTGANRVNGIQYTNKTGTTNFSAQAFKDYNIPSGAVNDLWCVGYSRDYAVALWYGYEKINGQYYNKTGNKHTSLFRAVIKGVLSGTKNFSKPSGIVEVEVEKNTSEIKKASDYTPEDFKTIEYFKDGTEPTETSDRFAQLPDVTNGNVEQTDTSIKLSWNKIETPNEFNEEYLKKEFRKVFTNDEYLTKFVTERIQENQTILGDIEYDIYLKDSEGNLSLVGTTSESTFEYVPSRLENRTYDFVIKTSYSIFKDNASKGASEIGISISNVTSPITSNINGIETVEILVGEIYREPEKPVSVTDEYLKDVTKDANISFTITNSSGEEVDRITTNTEETYTITYQVRYKEHKNTLKKTVIVKNQ